LKVSFFFFFFFQDRFCFLISNKLKKIFFILEIESEPLNIDFLQDLFSTTSVVEQETKSPEERKVILITWLKNVIFQKFF